MMPPVPRRPFDRWTSGLAVHSHLPRDVFDDIQARRPIDVIAVLIATSPRGPS